MERSADKGVCVCVCMHVWVRVCTVYEQQQFKSVVHHEVTIAEFSKRKRCVCVYACVCACVYSI